MVADYSLDQLCAVWTSVLGTTCCHTNFDEGRLWQSDTRNGLTSPETHED